MAKVLYKPHTWIANEHITINDLNNIENGIIDIYAIDEDLEKMDNKVTTGILTEDNTHTQYPSMKVVWDSFQKVGEDNLTQYANLKSNTSNIIDILCYFDDKITVKNLKEIYAVDKNKDKISTSIPTQQLIIDTEQEFINKKVITFLSSLNSLQSIWKKQISSTFIRYIEPNNGNRISGANTFGIAITACARPPRKMEFVSLNENNTIYQNGATLTISEIRDNLIFYAQDGYEWTYEQDGQTKKYADFLNDSDFSFENGEQSIQLQMTNDNALSESQELTINCNKTYGPSDFLQTINFSINVPIIINRAQISNIRLYTPPTQRVYLKGKDTKAVYTGLQLQLIDENNNVWSSSNYPNGIIPLNELSITNLNISSLEQEEDIETYHGYDITWTSPSLVDENNTPITMNISVGNDNQDYRLIVSTYHAKTMEIDTTNATTNYNPGDVISKTGLNIVIKDSRGQPYIGLTNGKPNSIDILINPTVATASNNIDYGESELQDVTASWIDSYNNNNKIENSYQIIINNSYPEWSTCSDEQLIEIITKIQQGILTFEQIKWTTSFENARIFNFSSSLYNKYYMPFTRRSTKGYLYIPENTSYTTTNGTINAFIIFEPDTYMKNIDVSNSWKNSNLRTFLNNDFLNQLNSNLTNLFKVVNVTSSKYVTTSTVDITSDKINLFSIFDIFPDLQIRTQWSTSVDTGNNYDYHKYNCTIKQLNSLEKERQKSQYKIPIKSSCLTRSVTFIDVIYEKRRNYDDKIEQTNTRKNIHGVFSCYKGEKYYVEYERPEIGDGVECSLACFAAI